MKKGLLGLLVVVAALPAFGAILTVTNNADAGPGTLRQAILDANQTSLPDTILFNLGPGRTTVRLESALPSVDEPLSIDGLSQPGAMANTASEGFNGLVPVQIDGALLADRVYGINISAYHCLVRGLSIFNFKGAAVGLHGGGSNSIHSCLLGVNRSLSVFGSGIEMGGTVRNTIGGIAPSARNVISGNGGSGINIFGSDANAVLNNLIGTDLTGTHALPNGGDGITIDLASKTNVIGLASSVGRNVIAGNQGHGVSVRSGVGNCLVGNFIGVDISGVKAMPNGGSGVQVDVGSGIVAGTMIGGTLNGEGNSIGFNSAHGVVIGSGRLNGVLGNAIFSNSFRGIALGYGNAPVNDAGDLDSGANDRQNFPVVTNAIQYAAETHLSGYLDSRAAASYRIEFFANQACDPYGNGQGKVFLGFLNVTNNSQGRGAFTFIHPAALAFGNYITATATDSTNNTSEFSPCTPVIPYNAVDLALNLNLPSEAVSMTTNFSYVLTVENKGPGSASNVSVTNQLAEGLSVVSAVPSQGNCEVVAGAVICHLGNLAGGASVSVAVQSAPLTNGTLEVSASIHAEELDPNILDNTMVDYVRVGVVDLAVVINHFPATAVAGQTLTYVATVTNLGPDTATAVYASFGVDSDMDIVSVSVSQGVFVNDASRVDVFFGLVQPYAIASITVTAVPVTAGSSVAYMETISSSYDPGFANDYFEDVMEVQDGPGVLGFAESAHSVSESAGQIVLQVLRSGGALGSVQVNFTTSNLVAQAGDDFVLTHGTLTFASGETSKEITVPIIGDNSMECNETFFVSLAQPTGGAVILSDLARVVILDNDLKPSGLIVAASRIDVAPDSPTAEGRSVQQVLSADGRYVAFLSDAADLVNNDGNGESDVFIRSISNGVPVLVSVNRDGNGSANSASDDPSLSANGKRIAFSSLGSDLVAGDGNGLGDVFLRDLDTAHTSLISVNLSGTGSGDHISFSPSITADGRYVAFASRASNLVTNDSNGNGSDIFLRDTLTGVTELISVNGAGTGSANDVSQSPAVSPDGRYVVFISFADNLGHQDGNDSYDIYARDRLLQTNLLLSANHEHTSGGADSSYAFVLSANGRFVAFTTWAGDLVPNDTNYSEDVFLYDLDARYLQLVSLNRFGTASANDESTYASLSADGRYVAFVSRASNLVTEDRNDAADVFVRDMLSATTFLVSSSCDGLGSANGQSGSVTISADGRFVTFDSGASDLTGGGYGSGFFRGNVFRRDLVTGDVLLVSMNSDVTGGGNGMSLSPSISADGRVIALQSFATDLVSNDGNDTGDIFLWQQAEPVPSLVPPDLIILHGPTSIQVRWPGSPSDPFILESAPSFRIPLQWSEVSTGINFVNGWKSLSVPGTSDQRYFRLVTP